MMIFHNNSSFLPLLFAIVAVVVVTVINPVAGNLGFQCRPAIDEYAECESTGDNIWNTRSYCMDIETSSNVLGCCPDDQFESWDDETVIGCVHGTPPGGWIITAAAAGDAENEDFTEEEEMEEDVEDIKEFLEMTAAGEDMTDFMDDAANHSSISSSAVTIAISVVVMIGYYY